VGGDGGDNGSDRGGGGGCGGDDEDNGDHQMVRAGIPCWGVLNIMDSMLGH
jgi:hypothetical protein